MKELIHLSSEHKEEYLKQTFPRKIRYAGGKSPQIHKIKDIASNKKSNQGMHIAVEGIWANSLALENHLDLLYVLANVDSIRSLEAAQLLEQLIHQAESCYLISQKTLNSVAESGNSAGIISVFALPSYTLDQLDGMDSDLIIVLDGLEIPGNVGTIVRSADGTDTGAVLITNKKTRLTHPKYIRSSQGSCFRVPVIEEDVDVVREYLTRKGYALIFADTDGSIPYYEEEYQGKVAIIMGSERYGISPDWYNFKHRAVNIPMFGACDSLNVSIAATLLLYEASLKKKGLLHR